MLAGSAAFGGEPWLAPGNVQARHDIQLLVDDGVINIPLSQWPIATADLAQALAAAERKYGLFEEPGGADDKTEAKPGREITLSRAQFAALTRLRTLAGTESTGFFGEVSGAARPTVLRTFRDEPPRGSMAPPRATPVTSTNTSGGGWSSPSSALRRMAITFGSTAAT